MRLLRSWYYQRRAAVLLRRIKKLLARYQSAIMAGDSWKQGYVREQINEADRVLSAVLDRWDSAITAQHSTASRGAQKAA